jgi:Holliday junction resolvase
MMINSNQKGKRGERELSKILTEFGYPSRRSQQFCGKGDDSADITSSLPFHIESKFVEKLNLEKAYNQALEDSKGQKPPIVCHRKSRGQWMVTMSLEDFLRAISSPA